MCLLCRIHYYRLLAVTKFKTPFLLYISSEQCDIWITFLHHHIHELQSLKSVRFYWATLYMYR